jgi:hypothetical protein
MEPECKEESRHTPHPQHPTTPTASSHAPTALAPRLSHVGRRRSGPTSVRPTSVRP